MQWPTLISLMLIAGAFAAPADDSSSSEEDDEMLEPELLYTRDLIRDLNTLCPGGEAPKECSCDNVPDEKINPPYDFKNLVHILQVLGCQPGFCKCANGEEVNARPAELRKILDVCDRGQMHSCTCGSDGSTVNFPFDMKKLFFECRPMKCKCKGSDEEHIITKFGCKNGGFSACTKNLLKPQLTCDEGATVVTEARLLEARRKGECVCPKGNVPYCKNTGKAPLCPDGQDIDHALGDPGKLITECKAN